MSCKTPILRAVFDSATLQAVAANGVINLPEVTSNSRCVTVSGGTINIRETGTYEVHWNVTTSAAAAGTENVQLFANGNPVPGSHALATAAAAANLVPLAATGVTTIDCCGNTALTLRSVPATNVRVANITLYKID